MGKQANRETIRGTDVRLGGDEVTAWRWKYGRYHATDVMFMSVRWSKRLGGHRAQICGVRKLACTHG